MERLTNSSAQRKDVESSGPFFEKFRREILSSVEKVIACFTSRNQANDPDAKAEDGKSKQPNYRLIFRSMLSRAYEETGQRMTKMQHDNAVGSLTPEETNILKYAYQELCFRKSSKSSGRGPPRQKRRSRNLTPQDFQAQKRPRIDVERQNDVDESSVASPTTSAHSFADTQRSPSSCQTPSVSSTESGSYPSYNSYNDRRFKPSPISATFNKLPADEYWNHSPHLTAPTSAPRTNDYYSSSTTSPAVMDSSAATQYIYSGNSALFSGTYLSIDSEGQVQQEQRVFGTNMGLPYTYSPVHPAGSPAAELSLGMVNCYSASVNSIRDPPSSDVPFTSASVSGLDSSLYDYQEAQQEQEMFALTTSSPWASLPNVPVPTRPTAEYNWGMRNDYSSSYLPNDPIYRADNPLPVSNMGNYGLYHHSLRHSTAPLGTEYHSLDVENSAAVLSSAGNPVSNDTPSTLFAYSSIHDEKQAQEMFETFIEPDAYDLTAISPTQTDYSFIDGWGIERLPEFSFARP
ncbi:hypothetical protein EV368DRAFT_85284 [Lentinula lateritia]|nr:hypothetical protein EV368DRAFT_85284 [Lentinula lateritia]